jgi:MoxR-like ATPase
MNSVSLGALSGAAEAVRAASKAALEGLVDREVLVELVALAAVAGEHLLVIGEPGTAKSEAVRRIAAELSGRYFEYLLGRFTEPSEIFGPVDFLKLQHGKVETQTAGMLPEAEIAFLDEVFQGSTAILNTLLGILNERRFRRGHTVAEVPLRLCVGASNALPEDPSLAAFADRFLVRVFVTPVLDADLESLLRAGRKLPPARTPHARLADLDLLARARVDVDFSALEGRLAQAVRLLRRAGIALSDRRIVRAQRLIAAAAVLAGRTQAETADLWPLVYAVPTALDQETARDALKELLEASESPLSAAALDASLGTRARARRIVEHAGELLGAEPALEEREGWLLRLEAIAREIDASFPAQGRSEPLESVRGRIASLLV